MKKRFVLGNVGLQWKIFAYLLCFCSVLLLLLWLFQTVFLESFYKYIKVSQVERASNSVISQIDGDLSEAVFSVSENYGVCIEVWDAYGFPVVSSNQFDDCIIHRAPIHDRAKIALQVLEIGELSGYYDIASFREGQYSEPDFHKPHFPVFSENETLLHGQKVVASDGTPYVLLVNSVLTPVVATVETIRVQLVFVSLFMIAFSVILAVILSKKISRPIARLNDSAKVLATGKYDVSFDGCGYREISELSESLSYAAVELSKVDSLRRDLIANISHDLRTPLTLIKGYSEAMRDLPDENNAENAQIIIDEAQRLTSLVNDALDLSKFQSGTYSLALEEFDLTLLSKGVTERFGKLVASEGYNVSFSSDGEAFISGDEILLSRVLYNLLINAMNYTGEDHMISVIQRKENGFVFVEVCDTGKGVSSDDIPYIWDKYYKAAKDKHNSVEGTGLGLSIVKSVLELHKGFYGVRAGESCGSVFWFSLPFFNNDTK